MRGVPKLLLAAAFAALLLAGLTACGSDDSGSDSAPTTRETTTDGSDSVGGDESGPSVENDGAQDSGGGSSEDSGSSADEPSAAFLRPGGDNSIQNFGEEADGEELEAADEVLSNFMEARAAEDWAGQCAALAKSATAPLEDLAAGSSQIKGRGCAPVLEALGAGAPPPTRTDTLTDGIASFRVEGEQGFAMYHGPRGVDYFVPMVEEDGEWKVGALAPSEFP